MSGKERQTREAEHGDTGEKGESARSALYTNVTRHPLVTGGVVLVAAGLAYAAAKVIKKSHEGSDVARDNHIEASIAIDRSPEELYAFWRDFKNLPRFMNNLESVIVLDHGLERERSHWVAKGIGGARIEWDAEIYNEKPNELISWRSLEHADVVNAGSVRFQRGPEGDATYVRVTMNYNPPGGFLGASLAQVLGAEPEQLINEDLRRFKQIMEAGIATE